MRIVSVHCLVQNETGIELVAGQHGNHFNAQGVEQVDVCRLFWADLKVAMEK